MLPFGRLRAVHGTQSQVSSHWLTVFERAGCEVTRESDARLLVRVPDFLDFQGFTNCFDGARIFRIFQDQLIVTVNEKGEARFSMVYFSSGQLMIHAVIAALFACGGGLGTGSAWLAQCAACGVALLGFRLNRAAVLATDSG